MRTRTDVRTPGPRLIRESSPLQPIGACKLLLGLKWRWWPSRLIRFPNRTNANSEGAMKIMLTEYDSMPVELLRDGRGVYGIGVSELFDYEAVWSRAGTAHF